MPFSACVHTLLFSFFYIFMLWKNRDRESAPEIIKIFINLAPAAIPLGDFLLRMHPAPYFIDITATTTRTKFI